MKWRITVGAAVLAVVVAVAGCVVALAGGSSGHPVTAPVTNPARYWLEQHAFLAPDGHHAVDVADVARTLLGLEPGFRDTHHVGTATSTFDDQLVTEACTYVFGHPGRINHVLHLKRFRFDIHASGPNLSPRQPGGTDHDGYALQCAYSHGPLGARLVQLNVSSGGVAVHNLTTYVQARGHGVTSGLAFTPRPRGLVARPPLHGYLVRRLARAGYGG